jgi:serine/threonine-protein kinase
MVKALLACSLLLGVLGCGGDEQDAPDALPAAPSLQHFAVGDEPLDIAVAHGVAWVANNNDGTVTRVEPSNGRVLSRTHRATADPSSLALSDGLLWVADIHVPGVTPLSLVSARPAGRKIRFGPRGTHDASLTVLASGDNGVLWAINEAFDVLWRIEPGARRGRRFARVGGRPLGLAVGAGAVWVASAANGTVTRVDVATGRAGRPVAVGRGPTGLAVADGVVWVANGDDDTVARIDADTEALIGRPIPVGDQPWDIAVADGTVWIAHWGDGTLGRLDQHTGRPLGPPLRIEDGQPIMGIAAGAGAIWVASPLGDRITRVTPG